MAGAWHPADLPEGLPLAVPGAELPEAGRHSCVEGCPRVVAWSGCAMSAHLSIRVGSRNRRSQPVEAIALVKRALRSVRGRSSHVKGAYGVASDGAARHP